MKHISQTRTQPFNMAELPDPFLSLGPPVTRVRHPSDWATTAEAWRRLIVGLEYGGMPPAPVSLDVETLCRSRISRWTGKPNIWTYRIHCLGGKAPFTFCVRVFFHSDGHGEPCPVIINGDACWGNINDAIIRRVLAARCALVLFNRTEMAEDVGGGGISELRRRSGSLYSFYPGMTFGAIAAWAWGYHRCVDLVQTLPFIDTDRIAVSGHSRGGKTALLAGATDPRIWLVNDNASGAGGSALFRYVGEGGETLQAILKTFPSWFGSDLRAFQERVTELPFDQHCLAACVAPRLLLSTYALDDRWANPEGLVQCVQAAREVYRFLGVPDHIAFHFREGPHDHDLRDWEVLLDFIRLHAFGQTTGRAFNRHPFRNLPPTFAWRPPFVDPSSNGMSAP